MKQLFISSLFIFLLMALFGFFGMALGLEVKATGILTISFLIALGYFAFIGSLLFAVALKQKDWAKED